MLIKINIIKLKKINILISFKKLNIRNYKITLPVEITLKKHIIKKAIYTKKSTVVLIKF